MQSSLEVQDTQQKHSRKYDSLHLDSKTILVTGAAGFIGSNLVEYFAYNHPKCRILALDYFRDSLQFPNGNPMTLGHFKNISLFDNVEILPFNITNTHDMNRLHHKYDKIDFIFHEAAVSDTTCMDMQHILRVNFSAFQEIIKLAMRHEAHIIYASSAATYGVTEIPNSVGKGEFPENIYGFSKLCMDKENRRLQKSMQDKGIGLIGLRYFNVYGKNEFYKHKTSSMILQLSLQALLNNEVKLFEFGEQQRDFVYIEDVVAANIKALELIYLTYGLRDNTKHVLEWQRVHKTFNDASMPKEPPIHDVILRKLFGEHFKEKSKKIMEDWLQYGAIYNVGYGVSRSYNDIIEILKKELNKNFGVQYIKNLYPFFQNHTLADSNNFLPNYKPLYTLEAGIKDYMPHIQKIYQDIQEGRKTW
ncbi:ADP-glyceromanno-heptose 6-epimerase [Helicobacter didelphidarum]|uniref:ADP-glyceromanno-heptose 6-epimerase n=1 Tax=Helicobacter didelphidarum TaxID=2040648 RepID=A0A3D8IFR4_9HELI|nr:NAD-dependent epimerase/dehydratase family protein [Helicobacter didelphidarum]RDU64077.1 ADP-glyceromanno-heptose 6-epimerase [Helicobacter didelphidarum]